MSTFAAVQQRLGRYDEVAQRQSERDEERAIINERMWQRDQAERLGLDPDAVVGEVLFTADEWQMMTGTRQARIDFGYEMVCGCRPGTCSYPEADCHRSYPYDEPVYLFTEDDLPPGVTSTQQEAEYRALLADGFFDAEPHA